MENEVNDITKCCISSMNSLYSSIPLGHFKLMFVHHIMESGNDEETDESRSSVIIMVCHYSLVDVCGIRCCKKTINLDLKSLSMKVRRKPFYRDGSIAFCCFHVIRDGLLSFLLAFLFHLVPSVIWGPENALGSSRNHAAMGIVWFGSWPVIACCLQCLRPYGIQFEGYNKFRKKKYTSFVSYPSKQYALEIQKWITTVKEEYILTQTTNHNTVVHVPPLPQLNPWDHLPFLIRFTFFIGLITNMFVTLYLVQQCINRGCCKDDENTLTSCRDTGYP